VRRFIDQYESGEQGCHMEADQAQSFAATLRALSARLVEVEEARDRIIDLIAKDQEQLLSVYDVHPDAWEGDPDRTDAIAALADAIIRAIAILRAIAGEKPNE